jgi:glycosyltransferase involved in cell wall biosynthesis
MNSSKIKLLFVIHGLSIGGAEKMLINLVNGLDQTKFSSDIVALSDKNPLANQIRPEMARLFSVKRRWRFDLHPSEEIRKIVINNKINAIIPFGLYEFLFVSRALKNIYPKPQVYISIHSTTSQNIKQFIQNTIYSRLLSSDERFVSVCNAQAEHWSKVYGIPRERFTTIYNGVNVEYFTPIDDPESKKNCRDTLGISKDAFIILQVASLSPHKRQEDALIAFKLYLEKMNNKASYLIFVGDGEITRLKNLQGLAQNLGVFDQVRFCGAQSDVRPYYEIADLFTLTSDRVETFSVATLEAMSMGIPSVITKIGGASEMILEGYNGYLVEPRNPKSIALGWEKISEKRIVFDTTKIRTYLIENFSLSTCIKAYEQLFLENYFID